MVSFYDINILSMYTGIAEIKESLNQKLIILWIFVICYYLSIHSSQGFPSVASILGLYYCIADIVTYGYIKYIKDDVEIDTESDNDADDESSPIEDPYSVENERRNKKAVQQLRDFEEMIRKKNLELNDYSDMPPLINIESIPSDLLSYINPHLRQPGQYAASINETGE